MPTEKQRAALKAFARSSDRDGARYFVGRTRICQAIQAHLQDCITAWAHPSPTNRPPWKSQTTLLQGAPGAGKSALLAQLASWLPEAVSGAQALHVCELDVGDLAVDGEWQKPLAEALRPGSKKRLEITESIQAQVSANFVVAKAGAEVTGHKPLLTWDSLLTEYDDKPSEFHPVLLIIDEVQNIPPEQEGAVARRLEYFHKATRKLPVFPLYGGLGYSEDKLADVGLSRLTDGRVFTLPRLTDSDCYAAVARFVADGEFKIAYSESHLRSWQRQIAEWSDGWPQHLTVGLKALATEIVQQPDHALAAVSLEKVFKHVQAKKAHYYQRRLENRKLQDRGPLAALGVLWVGRRPRPLSIPELGVQLEQLAGPLGAQNPVFALPAGYTGEQFTQAMIAAGLLHKKNEYESEVPIPSLVTHIVQGPLRAALEQMQTPSSVLALLGAPEPAPE